MIALTKHQHDILMELSTGNHLIDYYGFPAWENGSNITLSRTTLERLAEENLVVCAASHPGNSPNRIYYKLSKNGRHALHDEPVEPNDRPLTIPQREALRVFWFNRVLVVKNGRLEWIDCDNCQVPRSNTVERLLNLGMITAAIDESVLSAGNKFEISEYGREVAEGLFAK